MAAICLDLIVLIHSLFISLSVTTPRAALQVCKPVLVKSISDVEISRSEFNHLHDYMTMRGLTDDESQQLWLKLQPREEEEEDMKVREIR